MGPGGGQAVIDDLHELVGIARRAYPGMPIVAFGHSLGATMKLPYAVRHPDELAGVVLCGFPAPVADVAALAAVFQAAVDAGQRDEPVDVLGGFNAAFEPARTSYDWLSRDPDEVDKYIADPLCGDDLPLTYGYFVDLFDVAGPAVAPAALARIAAPVMVIAGACDPAAGMGAHAEALATALEQAGVSVRSKIYPDARHELLNEINRDEVTADVIAFITEVTKA
jgi:alpha-beta hydrolase superfamily lysophospholipase